MNIHAKKSLGQNFLVNPHIIDKIIEAAEVSKDDIILEVGPGTSNLTKKLAERSKKVIAIEKDHRLIEPLKEIFKNYPNVEIIEGDVIKFDMVPMSKTWAPCQYKIVANIPYYITSIFLRKIFEEWPTPKLIVLTIQKEVAQRIIAKPPHMNLLALSIQYYTIPEIIGYISKNNFRPVPKVDSAIVGLAPKIMIHDTKYTMRLFDFMKAGFSGKRKQLAGNLSKHLKVSKEKTISSLTMVGLSSTIRAEELSLNQWQELEKIL